MKDSFGRISVRSCAAVVIRAHCRRGLSKGDQLDQNPELKTARSQVREQAAVRNRMTLGLGWLACQDHLTGCWRDDIGNQEGHYRRKGRRHIRVEWSAEHAGIEQP